MNIKMQIQYIGACSLLGRLSKQSMPSEDLDAIKRALDDCAALFPGYFEVWKTSSGGYSLEPILTSQRNRS